MGKKRRTRRFDGGGDELVVMAGKTRWFEKTSEPPDLGFEELIHEGTFVN